MMYYSLVMNKELEAIEREIARLEGQGQPMAAPKKSLGRRIVELSIFVFVLGQIYLLHGYMTGDDAVSNATAKVVAPGLVNANDPYGQAATLDVNDRAQMEAMAKAEAERMIRTGDTSRFETEMNKNPHLLSFTP